MPDPASSRKSARRTAAKPPRPAIPAVMPTMTVAMHMRYAATVSGGASASLMKMEASETLTTPTPTHT